MKEIKLEQGEPNWLAWRAGEAFADLDGVKHEAITGPRITATTASVCGGASPFATPHELWGQMLGLRKRPQVNFVMLRGSAMEPAARKAYSDIVGEEYEPVCVQSVLTPWVGASLDGVDMFRTRGVEIKCPISEKGHDMAMLGEVPSYYFDQMQWQMLATDNQLEEMDYFSYAPKIGKAAPITVRVDLKRQAELVAETMRFRLAVMTRVPLSGSEFEQAAQAFLVLNRKLKALEAELESAKERVKKLADGTATQGGGVMVTVSNSEGRVAWEKVALSLIEKHSVPVDEVDALKTAHKGKPSKTISVKEAADADAVYAALIADQNTETSVVECPTDAPVQPSPVW